MSSNSLRYSLSNIYRKSIIRFFDGLAPLKGPLNQSNGVIYIQNYYSKEQIVNMTANKPSNVVDTIKQDSYLTGLFSDYLNKWNIDTCFMWETEEGQNNSSIWHHDSVGHRIKIFIGVSKRSSNTGTLFVSDSFKNKYDDYLSTRVHKVFTENETFLINLDVGDLMIFDTNCIHSGLYGDNPRKAITVEISNPFKGFLLPGKIGKKDFRENEFFS